MAYRRSQRGGFPSPVTVLATVATALIAGVALGGVLHATGNLRTVAALYGLEGVVNEWTLVLCHSVFALGPFVALVNRSRRGRRVPRPLAECHRNPFLCACLGTAYGVVLWAAVIAYGAPVAFGFVTASAPPIPYRHWGAFYALLVFGAVAGAWYPLLREFFDELQ